MPPRSRRTQQQDLRRPAAARGRAPCRSDGGHLQGRLRQWVSKTYREVGEIVRQLALGLIELGIEKGDKVSILANTRPEWTYFDFAALSAGATVVPIYQTNSPEECQYVLENSDAKAVVVEDDEQLAKIDEIRDRCPKLEHVIRMDGRRAAARSRWTSWPSAARAARTPSGSSASSSVTPDDICTFIYTSGTTGPPKGCVISHGNYRSMLDMALDESVLERDDDHLPLPPPRALLRPADPAPQLRPRRRRSPTGSATR